MHSSVSSDSFLLGLDASELASTQASTLDVQAFKTAITILHIQPVKYDDVDLCNISLGQPQPVVPDSLHRRVFDNLHSLACPVIKATQKLIGDCFFGTRCDGTFMLGCTAAFVPIFQGHRG